MKLSDIIWLFLFLGIIILWIKLNPKFIYNELENKLFLFYGPKDDRKTIDLSCIL